MFERNDREALTRPEPDLGLTGRLVPHHFARGKMLRFRMTGLPEEIAEAVRTQLRSPQYGHPAHVETASGYGPCRVCLNTFEEGREERILFTYQPFQDKTALPAPGPVFVHRDPCSRYDSLEFPEELRQLPLVLDGHGREGVLVSRERVGDQPVDDVLQRQFSDPRVDYIHLRNADAGCFIARIDRVFACD
jgi:hypothetical protein